MERLSGLDAAWLTFETRSQHMHVASAAVLDPSGMPGGYSFRAFRDLVDERLHLIPLFRRRIVRVPLDLHLPVWVDDPGFDLDFHVRRAALPSPGGLEELAAFAADVISRPLDRARPLWELWVVEGLENGHIAVVTKTHHAAIDGVSGAELVSTVLDTEPDAPREDPPPWEPEPFPSEVELLASALGELALQPFRLARTAARTGTAVGRLALRALRRPGDRGQDAGAGDEHRADPPPAPFTAPRTPFNTSISPHRVVAFTSLALDDLKAVKDAAGVKLNDVVLAVCGGALRSYLLERGELPATPLVAFVPISVRDEAGRQRGSNQVSAMLSSLATDTADPLERLHRIAGGTSTGKSQHRAIGATTLTDWTEFAAPAVFSQAARLYARTRMADRHRPLYNIVVSNVPGPQVPLYMAGAQLQAMYPMGPVVEGGALNITVMSYLGQLCFGVVAAREVVGDVAAVASAIEQAARELRKAAERSPS